MQTAPVRTVQNILRRSGAPGWSELHRRFGRSFWLQGAVVSADPAVVRAMLTERVHTERRAAPYRLMDRIVPGSSGILFKDGEEWVRRLRVLMPSFTASRIDTLAEEIVEAAAAHVASMAEGVRHPDLAYDVSRLGARTVIQSGYNLDPDDPVAQRLAGELIGYKFATMGHDRRRRIDELGFHWTSLRHLPWWLLHQVELRRRMRRIDAVVHELIGNLPIHDPSRKGWIELLMDGGFRGKALVDELNHLYGAYNAVDYVVTCALVELDRHPDVAAGVRSELNDRVGMGGRIGLEDVDRLPRTRAFILEVLRRYPVAMVVFRETGTPLEIADEIVPAGTVVVVPLYALHHDSEHWQEPESFRPERWLRRNERDERWSYIPFLDGPRKCIGQRLAEMQILAALLAFRKHRVRIDAAGARVNHYIVPRWDRPVPYRIERDAGG